MPNMPSDDSLIQLALTIAADKIATDPLLRDSLSKRLLSPGFVDPDLIVSRLLTLRDRSHPRAAIGFPRHR